ncbi:TPA: HEPN domain-containing protein [Legionella feeleii]
MDPQKGKSKISINDIIEKIKREKKHSYMHNPYKLQSLMELIPTINKIDSELLSYIPIKLITILECYFKDVIREFVDHEATYAKKLIEHFKNIQIDLDLINFLAQKKITLGRIFSQIIPVQRVDSIVTLFESLGLNDFKKKISIYLKQKSNISLETIFKTLTELNRNRNIIVHENSNLVLSDSQIIIYIEQTLLFLEAVDNFIGETLYPNSSYTQLELNQYSYSLAEESNRKVRSLISRIVIYMRKHKETAQIKQFLQFYRSRASSILEYAKFNADFYKGGSIYPLIFNSCLKEARINFLEELQRTFINVNDEIEIPNLQVD